MRKNWKLIVAIYVFYCIVAVLTVYFGGITYRAHFLWVIIALTLIPMTLFIGLLPVIIVCVIVYRVMDNLRGR